MIYCDNAATTRPFDEVIDLMADIMRNEYGNPSSLHKHGSKAKKLMETARQQVANLFNCSSNEVIFTSGGTESNNLAILGLAGWARQMAPHKNHLISCVTEHSSVYAAFKRLEEEKDPSGKNIWQISWLPVNEEGFISLDELAELIGANTLLVSIMHANNEIGTIQDIDSIGRLCKAKGVYFHSDAVQSAGKIELNVTQSQLDLLSISGHKLNGPKGIGALFVREGIPLHPIMMGGSQERGLSPGTENIAAIAGLGKAAELKQLNLQKEAERLRGLQQALLEGFGDLAGITINGPKDLTKRIPGNLNLSFENIDGDTLVMRLNMKGICASSGSACSEGKIEPSRVILSLYPNKPHLAQNSLRLSLGHFNSAEELPQIIELIRQMSN